MNGQDPKVFEIGLAMAGAVSAGAYTAGVFDFLIEALDEWEKARKANGAKVPSHRVVIKVMSGASAGAVTGALGAVSLAGGLKPKQIDVPGLGTKINMVLPTLYDTWVVRPRMVAAGGGRDLLDTEDLAKSGAIVRSVLNAGLLDDIREAALKQTKGGEPKPYIATELHIYLTISNLRGIPYQVPFEGGAYGMQTHGDRMHYVVTGLGSTDAPSVWAGADSTLPPLDTNNLFPPGPSEQWVRYANAAVASAAFPVGFAPRPIDNETTYYKNRYLPIDFAVPTYVDAKFPEDWLNPDPRPFAFLSVDGGMINNEPFEYARSALMKEPPKPNERTGEKADRAVIMIDPFPEPPNFLPDNKPDPDIVSVAAALFPALINQARFKPSELYDALDPVVYSRFLVAPHRNLNRADGKDETFSIACGLLGGFGGFFDEGFRQHDFQLGRRNCQRFLKEVFALPDTNDIIKSWSAEARRDFHTTARPGEPPQYPIIPVMGTAAPEVKILPWPRMSTQDLDTLNERIEDRLSKLAPRLIEAQTKGRSLRLVLKFAVYWGKSRLLQYIKLAILSDMIRRDQIAGWDLPDRYQSEATRKVLAELAAPAYDLRTIPSLVRSTLLDRARVEAILNALAAIANRPYSIWQTTYNGAPAYTLESRKPSAARRFPILGQVISWFDELTVD